MKYGPLLATIFSYAVLTLSGCQRSDQELSIDQPWVRHAPPNSSMLAGYGTLTNTGRLALTLKNIHSPRVASISLHQTIESDGRSSMQSVPKLTLAPNESITFEPGSYHLMLMQPHTPLILGEQIPITMEFKDGYSVTQNFTVAAP